MLRDKNNTALNQRVLKSILRRIAMSAENETIAAPQRIEEVQQNQIDRNGHPHRTLWSVHRHRCRRRCQIHISQLGDKRVNRVSDALKVGDEVTVWVDKADLETNQIIVS